MEFDFLVCFFFVVYLIKKLFPARWTGFMRSWGSGPGAPRKINNYELSYLFVINVQYLAVRFLAIFKSTIENVYVVLVPGERHDHESGLVYTGKRVGFQ